MRRRQFITLIGGAAAAWPLTALAQLERTKILRVGIIDDAPIWDHFRKALHDAGYTEGKNILFEYRVSEGKPERLAVAAADLARLPVNVIAVYGAPASLAAKAATSSIPIVAISVGDPIRTGLVRSLARPGGNVTGNTILAAELGPKRLQLIKEVVPLASRVAFLWNPNNAASVVALDDLRSAAAALGLSIISVEARSSDDFEHAFKLILGQRADVVLITNDPLHQQNVAKAINFMIQNKLPGMFQTRENVLIGGLMSYGTSFPELFRHGASYVHRILQGEKPQDLPMRQPERFEFIINLKTAKASGLTIPPTLITRADEVIE